MDKERIVEEAARLLEEGYDGVLGLCRRWGHVGPYLFTNREELDDLELEPRYLLAPTLRQIRDRWPGKRLGIVARGCDERALTGLEERGVLED